MAVGSAEKPHSKAINITRLRKNLRKRQDKTSGRKKPRLQDVDVVPADDMDDDTDVHCIGMNCLKCAFDAF